MSDAKDEFAQLERLNENLKQSLLRCRNMLHDYEVRLAANSNLPAPPADEHESGTA